MKTIPRYTVAIASDDRFGVLVRAAGAGQGRRMELLYGYFGGEQHRIEDPTDHPRSGAWRDVRGLFQLLEVN